MDFKVFLSQDALSDLERIVAYIAPDNPGAAERTGSLLLDTALSLETHPERGRVVPEFRQANIRELVVRPYRIIYRVRHNDASIEVVRFWHGTRGVPQLPPSV
jgi:toxin ParE1/3/4